MVLEHDGAAAVPYRTFEKFQYFLISIFEITELDWRNVRTLSGIWRDIRQSEDPLNSWYTSVIARKSAKVTDDNRTHKKLLYREAIAFRSKELTGHVIGRPRNWSVEEWPIPRKGIDQRRWCSIVLPIACEVSSHLWNSRHEHRIRTSVTSFTFCFLPGF
jgi:hypothetical protein